MKIWQGESGIAILGVVLILVMVGAIVLPVLLYFMNTASKAGQIVERQTKEDYSASSGIDSGLWRIKTDGKLPAWLDAIGWDESVYGHAAENYTLSSSDPINDNSVVYQIGAKWVLEGLETPNATQKRNPATFITVAGNYTGTGSTSSQGAYEIAFYFSGIDPAVVKVSRIACWLPAGCQLVANSSNLGNASTSTVYHCDPTTYSYRSGTVVSWDYASPIYCNKLPQDGTRYIVTFQFTPNQIPQGVFCWIKTNDTGNNYLAWNTDLKIFQVTSMATSPTGQSTVATAYSTKKEWQKFGSVIEGDYVATGNTLMRDTDNPRQRNRDRLYKGSSQTVSTIPANAQVQMIYLYWTGWKCKPWNAWNYTATQQAGWPATYHINQVAFNVLANGVNCPLTVTASTTQVVPNGTSSADHGWAYSCFANITSDVKNFYSSHGGGFVGNGTYTVGHWDLSSSSSGHPYSMYAMNQTAPYPYSGEGYATPRYTAYPLGSLTDGGQTDSTSSGRDEDYLGNQDEWAYAAWSVIVIYTSPSTKGHQVYIYDTLRYNQYNTLDFNISGFLTPDLTNEPNAAKITCFVGEGDGGVDPTNPYTDYTGDSIAINGTTLPGDAYNPSNDVWNSQSFIEGNLITGIDIDTFNISNTIINPGDNQATVALTTNVDAWNMVYMILSFRSAITAGGIFIYNLN